MKNYIKQSRSRIFTWVIGLVLFIGISLPVWGRVINGPSHYVWTTTFEITFQNGDKDMITHQVKRHIRSGTDAPIYTIVTVKSGILFDDPVDNCIRSGCCGEYFACNVRSFKIIKQIRKAI